MSAGFNMSPNISPLTPKLADGDFGPSLTLVALPEAAKNILAKATMNDAGEWVYEDRSLERVGNGWLENVRCKTCGRWNCTLHSEAHHAQNQ